METPRIAPGRFETQRCRLFRCRRGPGAFHGCGGNRFQIGVHPPADAAQAIDAPVCASDARQPMGFVREDHELTGYMIQLECREYLLALLDGTSEVHLVVEDHRGCGRRAQVLHRGPVPEHVDIFLWRFSAMRQFEHPADPIEVTSALHADEIADTALRRRSCEAVRMTNNPVGHVAVSYTHLRAHE